MGKRFVEYCQDYGRHFVVYGKDSSGHARDYLSGLLGKERRKNIGRIGEDVAQSNYQGMQQLISDSPWDHEAVMADVARDANRLLGGHRDAALYLDESSFVKKGNASVGVARQYCGRLGKLENCQVGVFACLGRGDRGALVDFDLFLPQAWAEDGQRCRKAKVPEDRQVHRTKAELALGLVERARTRGLEYQWIGGDEIYGNNQTLCSALEDAGEVFLMDVASNLHVWEENPRPALPAASRGVMGRPPTRAAATVPGLRAQKVAELSAACFEKESRWITLRETTKGPLRVQLMVKEVWLWSKEMAEPRRRLLVVRREADGSHKYSLTNASTDLSWERLGFMQAQRFFIERAFQDAKSQLGMSQYEVRGWRGWYHHMTMCCLALLFCLKERLAYAQELPLLSVRDIVELLDFYLPRRDRDLQCVLANLHARHRVRASAIKHAEQRRKIITK